MAYRSGPRWTARRKRNDRQALYARTQTRQEAEKLEADFDATHPPKRGDNRKAWETRRLLGV